jgi:hypothetical protein
VADEVTPPQPQPQPLPQPLPPPEPARNRWVPTRRTLRAVGWGVLAVMLVAAVLAGVAIATGDRAGGKSLRAKPGDCLAGDSDSDLKRVPCDDQAVKWTVLAVLEHKTQKEAKQEACGAWPDAEASYWESRNSADGFVLCLGSAGAG